MKGPVLDISLKILAGTAAFALYRYWARRAQHSRAGMMLTFPALNGLGLALTGEAGTSAKAAAMFPMIAVNGGLCFAAVMLAPILGQLSRIAAIAAVLAALLIWICAAVLLPPLSAISAVVLLFAFIAGGWMRTRRTWPVKASARSVPADPWWKDRWLWAFSAMLALLLLAVESWNSFDEGIGKASALPLLPLFGLASQMTRGPDALDKFAGTVLFGPPVALAFVIAVTWLIEDDVLLSRLPIPHAAMAMLYVGLGWYACIGMIEAIARRAERAG
jgi:hypothetical protein